MKRIIGVALFASFVAVFAAGASAQEKTSYVALGPARAVYATPAQPARVAFLVIRRTADFTTHIACQELPRRGIAALCMSPRFVNNEFAVDWDRLALDVKAGVEFTPCENICKVIGSRDRTLLHMTLPTLIRD